MGMTVLMACVSESLSFPAVDLIKYSVCINLLASDHRVCLRTANKITDIFLKQLLRLMDCHGHSAQDGC